MMDFITGLRDLLARDDLTVADVVRAIGDIASDPGIPMPMELRPATRGIRSASLARYPDSAAPYLLKLEFEDDARPMLGPLAAALGPYHRIASDRGMPIAIRFEHAAPATGWKAEVFAEIDASDSLSGTALVRSVALRRDSVLSSTDRAHNEVSS